MYKKLTASLMAALMSILTIAVPALAATSLSDYPTFLLNTDKSLNSYVVVGATASTSDVVGAIDLATTLAQAAATTTTNTVSGTTQGVTGTERKIVIPGSSTGGVIGGSGSNNLPTYLYTYHYSGLLQGQYQYKGTYHNYKEMVVLGSSTPVLTHKLGDPVNGTLKMKIDTGAITYKYQFLDTISDFGSATSANATTYQNPIVVSVAGKTFNIVAIPSTASFRALSGSVGWVTQGSTGLTVDGLSLSVSTVYSDTKASVTVVDANGNTIKDLGVIGTDTQTFTYNGATYSVKLLTTATVTVAGTGSNSAQLAFAKGDVDKLYDGSDTAYVSDWTSDWKVSGQFATQGVVTTNDNITVTYNPSSLADANKYYTVGSTFKGPGDYFELSYVGYTPNKFATVNIAPVTGKTIYNTTTSTGYATNTSLNGLEISTDVSGSIVYNSVGYSDVYVLFGATPTTGTFAGTPYWTGYWDKTTSRIVQFSGTPSATGTAIAVGTPITLTLSYGGPGATTQYAINLTFSNNALIGDLSIYNVTSAGANETKQVDMNFINRTGATSGSSIPDMILGATASTVDTGDVVALVEGSQQDTSSQITNVITDNGIQIYSVKSNVQSDKVSVGIPPEQVYGDVQFGKVTAGAAGSTYTTVSIVPITTAVAKLDNEITTTDEAAKDFVLVGGPCVNTLVASLATAGKFDYTCSNWPASNFAIIKVVDDAFTSGKQVVIVAGTRAADTRLGTSVLQQYNQAPVSGKLTGTSIKVVGTAVATATITAA